MNNIHTQVTKYMLPTLNSQGAIVLSSHPIEENKYVDTKFLLVNESELIYTRKKKMGSIKNYQLSKECLGKGSFGSVYKALNMETGEAVAIKQVKISDLQKSELTFIMSEIELLKNLNHPNIVKYKGYVKADDYLNIILEFCENGSLLNVCKKFGKFPENLVAIYISQVLEGLLYLHDQGVIHRDIKGANILTTKEGLVKLADFGVATKTANISDFSVVGSPYWMAPEIIELSGATTSSDIWSVGCVVIELLEGKPPYHNLEPMPALFRIVEDEHPPLPESASPAVKDFLMQCFQKDSNLRVSARKLLKHSWISNVRKPNVATEFEDAIRSVKEWNEALKDAKFENHKKRRSGSIKLSATMPSKSKSPLSSSSLSPKIPDFTPPVNSWENLMCSSSLMSNSLNQQNNRLSAFLEQAEVEGNNWDNDFVDSISLYQITDIKIRQLSIKSSNADIQDQQPDYESSDDDSQTVRPNQFINGQIKNNHSVLKDPGKQIITEDNIVDAETNGFKNKPNGWEYVQDTVIHLLSKSVNNSSSTLESSTTETNGALDEKQITDEFKRHIRAYTTNDVSNKIVISSSRVSTSVQQEYQELNEFQQYQESEDEQDYNKAFRDSDEEEDGVIHTLKFNAHLYNESWKGDDSSDEDDPFAELEEKFDEMDMEAHIARDKYANACSRLAELLNLLQPTESEDRLISSCVQIIDLLTEHQELKNHFIIFHGVIPITEVLEICANADLLSKLLKIVNIIIADNIDLQENLCLVGGIPIIMSFTSKRYPYEIRVEAAIFIRQICHTSPIILQMFISCQGLRIFVDFLQEEYTKHKELIWIAVNGIYGVFELQSPTPKNDFCRLLAKIGVLDPLAITLHNVIMDDDLSAKIFVDRIVNIFLMFSRGDAYVKEFMATRTRVVTRIFEDLYKLPSYLIVIVLKCIKNISMNSITLDSLQKAKAIQILTELLDNQVPSYVTEISNQVLHTMFNLCRIDKSRQEEAARAGLIPHLVHFASNNTPLRHFAIPILCEMAHTGQSCRDLLWQNDVLQLYLNLLVDRSWQVSAFEAILSWFQEETSRVEPILLQQNNIELILESFVVAKANSFENILEPLYMITQLSAPVTCVLAQPSFFDRLLHRFGHPKPVVRLNLLRILKSICDVHPQREDVIKRYGLFEIIIKMSAEDPAVLIRELAKEILQQGYFTLRKNVN
ncbi:12466_t:CDS:2 [Dentiscutata erythropus]|uniref:non-specific serine/threonine protein kinase n=1 Tax=Dentiscutata erythropus TaxID=1348616 RepID=A0A9N9ARV3_9GLOM|nr:12466_t:CDS:2 [Dentiscutata erythropus]